MEKSDTIPLPALLSAINEVKQQGEPDEAEVNALIETIKEPLNLFEKAIAAIGDGATWEQVVEFCFGLCNDQMEVEDAALAYSAWVADRPGTMAYIVIPHPRRYAGDDNDDDEVADCIMIHARECDDVMALAITANVDECGASISVYRVRNMRAQP